MPTPYSTFYLPMRTILGDRDPFGNFAYLDADLNAALDVLFLTKNVPGSYEAASASISPAVATGDDFALILYRAAKLLLDGEDGASSMKTRALSVSDQGHRKRDLLTSFRQVITQIENGGDGIVFETRQSLGVFLHNLTGESFLDWANAGDYVTIPPLPL